MASAKLKDLVVKVGSYTDRNTGQDKSRWETIGALMQSDDGSMFVMIKRTFNPAGVPNQENRESILVSAFDPQQRDGSNSQRGNSDAGGYQSEQRGGTGKLPVDDLDSEIPF